LSASSHVCFIHFVKLKMYIVLTKNDYNLLR